MIYPKYRKAWSEVQKQSRLEASKKEDSSEKEKNYFEMQDNARRKTNGKIKALTPRELIESKNPERIITDYKKSEGIESYISSPMIPCPKGIDPKKWAKGFTQWVKNIDQITKEEQIVIAEKDRISFTDPWKANNWITIELKNADKLSYDELMEKRREELRKISEKIRKEQKENEEAKKT